MARSGLRRYPDAIRRSLDDPFPGLASAPSSTPPHALLDAAFGALWIGHATALLRMGGLHILTDPVLSQRIGISLGDVTLGLDRLAPPSLDAEAMPPIDVILISHAHFDHLDLPTLKKLASPRAVVVTARKTARLIPSGYARVVELDWEERIDIGPLNIRAVRPQHWGARRAFDRTRGYNAYLLEEGPTGGVRRRVFFAGDTAFTRAFARLAPVDLALLGIGAYDPWVHAHATPEQAWEMSGMMRAQRLLPLHHSTFELSDERPDEPMQRLLVAASGDDDRIVGASPGDLWIP